MPVIDGVKFACSSCIKGHRVSGCNHTDRELHHIQPKGRPVKQCEHCRVARKSKSHHAKCDCGEKKDKHKDKTDVAANDKSCCCHIGAKCICGIKDTLDLKIDTGKQTLHGARHKPKLTTANSESHLTVFANGHHKPCHRNNNTAHVSGAPYKISRTSSLYDSTGLPSTTLETGCGLPGGTAQRSADTSSLSNNDYYAMFGSAQYAVSFKTPCATDTLDAQSLNDLFPLKNPLSGQDDISPGESPYSDSNLAQQWPWKSTFSPYNRDFSLGSLSTSPSQNCLPQYGNDWAIPSAGADPVWTAGDLPLDPTKLSDTLTKPLSHSGGSKHSGPGLTASSSSHSETGEVTWLGDLDNRPLQSATSELFWEDRMVPSISSEALTPPSSAPSMPASNQGLDFDVNKNLNTTSAPMDCPSDANMPFFETSALSMPNDMDDISVRNWLFDDLNAFDHPFDNNNWA